MNTTKKRLLKAKSRVREQQRCAARFDELCASMPVEQTYAFERRYIKCGRDNCVRCPHGPYFYAFWRKGSRMRNRYIGRYLPTRAKVMQNKKKPLKHIQIAPKPAQTDASEVEA